MFDDLRDYVQRLDEMGQLIRVDGADWDLEIGTITELMAERDERALLFDRVKGYPKGYRIVTNILNTKEQQRTFFDDPEGLSDIDIIRHWRDKFNGFKPVPPVEVDSGPVSENVLTGDQINILKFPVPKWHELDGGRYIGTGVVTITRDPEEGWLNLGVYRVMVHDGKTVAFYTSPGKHANLMRQKYWAKGESCPVVMCFGQEPAVFAAATFNLPWGMSELEVAGYIKGEPIKVIKGPITGLPIPATAEIVIEGFSPPPTVDSRAEGPFGEWTGYYASGTRNEPVVHIERLYHRDEPIIHGQAPLKPPHPLSAFYPIPVQSASALWDGLEKLGMQGITGVWVHGPNGRPIGVISIKQRYLGHSRQIASLAASLLQGGAIAGRYIIVVDDDINPANWGEVEWAVTTRCDPDTSIDLVRGFLSSPLDPAIPPEKRARGDFTTTKVLIDACRPYHWRQEFPPVNRASDELRKRILDKWSHLFAGVSTHATSSAR